MGPRAGLILANRAYIDHSLPPGSAEPPSPSGGGLVAALRAAVAPGLGERDSVWIGAGRGSADRAYVDSSGRETIGTDLGPLQHQRLFFEDWTWDAHYSRVSNAFLWPLLHLSQLDLPALTGYYPKPHPTTRDEWASFERVNRAFADAALDEQPGRTAWVHDYQLALVPAMLRQSGFRDRIGFFLHTPFPSLEKAQRYLADGAGECFSAWCRGVLGADLVGFQTEEDLDRFRAVARTLGAEGGRGGQLVHEGRTVSLRAIPVGIDVQASDNGNPLGASWETAEAIRAARAPGLPLVVALERADYTKGIPERHRVLARAAERGCRFAYLGISAPTRPGVAGYESLGTAIWYATETAADAVRGAGGTFDYRSVGVSWNDVLALLSEADVVFTSSLSDGMNLVPLQAVLAQSHRPASERATILVGRGAGVSSAYRDMAEDGLIAIDPLDVEQTSDIVTAAVERRTARISGGLIAAVRARSAQAWAAGFLTELEGTQC